jgi:ribulose 1,5-bisphosphate carboxylase large subunit-like protein
MVVQLLMQTPEVQKARLQRLSSGVDLLIDDERLTPMGKELLQELLA